MKILLSLGLVGFFFSQVRSGSDKPIILFEMNLKIFIGKVKICFPNVEYFQVLLSSFVLSSSILVDSFTVIIKLL